MLIIVIALIEVVFSIGDNITAELLRSYAKERNKKLVKVHCKKIEKMKFKGVVKAKWQDTLACNGKRIDNIEIQTRDSLFTLVKYPSYGLYEKLNIGDTVIKKLGEYDLNVQTSDSSAPSFILRCYLNCDKNY